MIAYVGATTLIVGTALSACVAIAARCLGCSGARGLHHLVQSLIPLAGAGLFLGLTVVTTGALHFEGVSVAWVPHMRAAALRSKSMVALVGVDPRRPLRF